MSSNALFGLIASAREI